MSVRARWLAALIGLCVTSVWVERFLAQDRCLDAGGRFVGWRSCEMSQTLSALTPSTGDEPQPATRRASVDQLPRELRSGNVTIRMVDSLAWRVEEGLEMEGVLWRIEVVREGRVDTVPDLFVSGLPDFSADTVITGLAYREDDILFGFRYYVGKGRLDTLPVVSALHDRSVIPDISPDGRFVAYWALMDEGEGRIEITDWPGQSQVYGGPIQVVGGTDASLGGVRWLGVDTLEYLIWAEGGRVLKGRWTPTGFGPVDTTTSE